MSKATAPQHPKTHEMPEALRAALARIAEGKTRHWKYDKC